MTVVNILIAAVVLGLMGLLFGLLLMGTEKVFAIPADEKRSEEHTSELQSRE